MSAGKSLEDFNVGYQRWQPTALTEGGASGAIPMPTAADLEAIHQQAHEEGFQAGYQEGLEAARQHRETALAEEVSQLQALMTSLSEAMQAFEQSVSEELLALALEISRQMLHRSLAVKPELLLPIVRAAVESLPQNTPHPHLHLHPEDAALVRAGLPTEMAQGGWKVIDDPRIARGGCRIETPVSEVDATVENRWKRLSAAFGQQSEWLDE